MWSRHAWIRLVVAVAALVALSGVFVPPGVAASVPDRSPSDRPAGQASSTGGHGTRGGAGSTTLRWRELTSGATTCGIATNATGWCWGENSYGQVGSGTTADRRTPYRLPGRWRTLASSELVTCGVRTDGSGWCWGRNVEGSVGNGGFAEATVPSRVPGTWRSLRPGLAVHGITTDGGGWTWGATGQWNQATGLPDGVPTPRRLEGTWLSLADRCGIRTDRSAWCWGPNEFGQVGDNSDEFRPDPVRLRTPGVDQARWASLDADGATRCGLLVDGTGWCWGSNRDAAVGWPDSRDRWAPYRLPGSWRSLQNELGTTCGVQSDGTAWCWGRNDRGQVGDGTQEPRWVPTRLPGTWASVDVWFSGSRVCGIRTGRSGWCWGWNPSGEVGVPTSVGDQLVAHRLPGRWRTLSSDGATCGVRVNRTGWCWGRNEEGAVGDGSGVDRTEPRQLPGLWRSVVSRTFAGALTCGVRRDGSGWCWGTNVFGGVGNGSRADRLRPFLLGRIAPRS